MDKFYIWQIILLLGIGTYLIRASFIFIFSKLHISDRCREVFSFIPAAVLPALITPMVFFHRGDVVGLYGKERFVVLVLASLVCLKTKSMAITVGFGMLLLYWLR